MSIYELLRQSPNPTDGEIKDALGGNLCRCTGYQSILSSVRAAAAKLQAAGGTATSGTAASGTAGGTR
jgi:carbon-monoxide dehydrogenase small subunit